MTINLANNDPRQEYDVTDSVNGQQVFTVDFEFFEDEDLNVYVDGTLKTLTTHYRTADNNDASNPTAHTSGTTGFVHFTAGNIPTPATGQTVKVVITRAIDKKRTTDFPSSGPFDVASLNEELDKLIAITAELQDGIDRSLRLTDFDIDATLTLPAVDTRKGKTLAFNATTGAAEAGPSISGVTTVAAMAADIATLADIEDGTVATDAISDLAAIASDVTGVNNISGAVTGVNTISSAVTAVNNNSTNINTVAGIDSDVTDVAGISGNVTTVAGIQANVTTVAGIQANVTTVAGNDTNINTVAGQISPTNNIATVAGIASDISTVAGDSADIQLLADNIATISAKENVGVAVAMAIALG